jgi:predicted MFS family arabinose efflux permease
VAGSDARAGKASRIRRSLTPLGTRPFRHLAASYTLNECGDSIGVIALAVLVYDETQSALATTALFVATRFVPALVAPALTARIDQLALRRVLPLLYLVEAAAFVALALVAGAFSLPAVLALGALDGTIALTGRAVSRGAVAAVLAGPGLLREGNAVLNVGFAVASVGGAALGGVLAGTAGVATALLVDAATFAGAALLVATAPGLPVGTAQREPFWQRLRGGLRHARTDPRLRLLLGGQAVAMVCFTLIVPVEVVYAKETLETTDAGYGILLAAWGAGIVLGSAAWLVLSRRSLLVAVLASTCAIGAAYLGMAAVDTLGAACALSVLGGAGNGVQWVAVVTALQERTPEELQARVVGLLESIAALAPGVGFLAGGVLTSVLSPPATFAAAGGGLLALVAAGGMLVLRQRARPAPVVPS